MSQWMVLPRVVRLPLSDGDWIDVKAQLNHGEAHAVLERCYVTTDGDATFMQTKYVQSTIVAYLVDWSATDLPIRGEPASVIEQALNAISQPRYLEIKAALDRHTEAIQREQQEKKTTPTGSGVS